MRKIKLFILIFILVVALCFKASGIELPWNTANNTEKETVVLLLSDIHFDPFVDGAAKELEKTPISGWRAVLEKQKQGDFPAYMKDTNYRLLLSAIDEISQMSADINSAIIGGDLLCHNFETKYRLSGLAAGACPSFAIKTIEFIADMIKQALPGKPIYFVMGNNDSDNGDYNIVPGGPMLKNLADYFDTVKADRQAAADFYKGGYYELLFPGVENNELIVLNDVFWHKNYRQAKKANNNPGEIEMKWLASKLASDEKNGKKAIIAMHIPPGIDTFLAAKDKNCKGDDGFLAPEYNKKFFKILKAHIKALKNMFAGHSHFDDFRVFSPSGRPALLTCIIPSISPVHGNNPAFELALIKNDGDIKDTAVYYLSGFGAKDAQTRAKWALEYTFCDAYRYFDYTPESLFSLTVSMTVDADKLDKYLLYYTVSNPTLYSLIKEKSRVYECALTSRDFQDFYACSCVSNY